MTTYTYTTESLEEAKRLTKATDMAIALFDIRQALRDDEVTVPLTGTNPARAISASVRAQTREELAERINAIMERHNIILEDILT